jgi:hypothetical protein
LTPPRYVISAYAQSDLLQDVGIQGKIKGTLLPRGQEMLNVHFADDSAQVNFTHP